MCVSPRISLMRTSRGIEEVPLVTSQNDALRDLEVTPFDHGLVARRVAQEAVDRPVRAEPLDAACQRSAMT